MKILVYSNMYPSKEIPYAGIYVKNQFEYLKQNYPNISFKIKTMQRQKTNRIQSILKYLKLIVFSFPLLFQKFDIIHVHFLSLHFIFPVIYKIFHPSTKIILTLHGSDVNLFSENKFLRFIINKVFTLTNTKTICVGKKLALNFHNKFYLKSDYILAAGVDDTVFIKDNTIDKVYDFTFVGSFTKIKGIDILIQAIKNTPHSLKWCFIGQGSYLNKLEKLQAYHNITIGHSLTHTQISKKLNKSKFFILPSRTEGFPLASIEALYCGVPVIASNLEQFKEQIKNNHNGFIVEHTTPDEISKTIITALSLSENDYNKMCINALNSNKEHSLKKICQKTVEIYKKLKEIK